MVRLRLAVWRIISALPRFLVSPLQNSALTMQLAVAVRSGNVPAVASLVSLPDVDKNHVYVSFPLEIR